MRRRATPRPARSYLLRQCPIAPRRYAGSAPNAWFTPISIVRWSEGEAAHAAIHRNDGAGDIARQRRCQEDGEISQFFRLAEATDRDLCGGESAAAFLVGVFPVDLLAANAA